MFHKLSPEQEEALIEEVRPFPCLFNIHDDLYKDSIHRGEICRKIGLKLGLDGSVVKDAWNSIRQKYKRESKKVKAVRSGAGSKEVHEPTWTHWRSLAFLKDIREDIVTSGNLESLWHKSDSQKMENYNFTQDLTSPRPRRSGNVPYVDECNPSFARSLVLPASNVRNQKSDVPSLKKNQNDTDEEHEDRIFFTSLLLHVKKVPQASKLAMRNEITKIVNKYAYTMQPPESRFMRAPQPLYGFHPSNVPYYHPSCMPYLPNVKQEFQDAHDSRIARVPKKRSRDAAEQESLNTQTGFSDDDDCQILEVGRSEKVFRSEETKPFKNPPLQPRKKTPASSTSTSQSVTSSSAASSTSSGKDQKTKSSTQPSSEEIMALIYKKLLREEKETAPQTVSQTPTRQVKKGSKKVEKPPKKTAPKKEENNTKKIEKRSSKMTVKITDHLPEKKDEEMEKEEVEMEKGDEDMEKEEEEMESENEKESFEKESEEED